MTETIGFIGLGIMGQGMCHNLLKGGINLMVWNRTVSKSDALETQGAQVASSIQALTETCSIIMLCVSDTPDVQAIIHEHILPHTKSESLIIDFSTISPKATQELAQKLLEKGIFMLDAPISGGSEGAAKGTLSIMVGGEAEQLERARPYLNLMGKTITHTGTNGTGQMTKLVNQILVVITMLGVGEALLFAQAGGLDLETTLKAVGGGAAGSWMLSQRGPQVIQRDWRPGFTIDLQQKDLRLVLEMFDELGIPSLGTSLVFNLYRTLQTRGLGGEGNHALVKALENLANIQIQTQSKD